MSLKDQQGDQSTPSQSSRIAAGGDTVGQLVLEPPQEGVLLQEDSEESPKISFVIPTLNEEDGIADCIQMIKNALQELGCKGEVIVSDSSTDRTPEIAKSQGGIVVSPDQPGYGYAYRYAFQFTSGDYIVIGDADTTYDFEELPKLFEHVANGDADMAMGSRLNGEIEPGAMPLLHRYIGNPLLTFFLNFFYDADVSDAHSGFRIIRREALEDMELQSNGMEFASEMVMEAAESGMSIAEEPITYHERKGEETLESFSDGWRHVRFILVNAPDYLFIGPAASIASIGLLLSMLGFFNINIGGQSFGPHSFVVGSLFVILGYQCSTFGVLSSIAADPIKTQRGPIAERLQDHFTLERGVLLGTAIFAIGFGGGLVMLYRWVTSGFAQLPMISADIFAFLMMVVGLQTVFNSFFASIMISSAD